MFENIINLVKQEAGNAIIKNPAIPDEHNEAAVHATSTSIIDTLKNSLAGGGLGGLLQMFGNSGGDIHSNPITQNALGGVIKTLMDKFGLNQTAASGIAGNIVPNVLSKLVSKANDPSDTSINTQDIFNHLSDGKTGQIDVQSLINKAGSGSVEGNPSLDNLTGMLSGNKEADQGTGMDAVKGLFGGLK